MKEDILEQIVEEYLSHRGYFVRHNVKFLPDKTHADFVTNQDSNHSDIDVIGIHPTLTGPERIVAVSCKSWQSGFNPQSIIKAIETGKKVGGKDASKHFRELTSPKWSEAFRTAVEKETGSREFTYLTAVTHLNGTAEAWERHAPFSEAMAGNPIRLITFKDMLIDIQGTLTTTLASTEIGRMIQIIRAAKIRMVTD